MTKTDVLGVGFDDVTPDEAVARALELISARRAAYVVTPNPEIIMLARENEELCAALNAAALVLPDGVGVVKGAAILGTPLKGKVPGIDFASALMAKLAERGGSVFLFGAKPGIAETAGEKLAEKYNGLVIAGACDGYFTDDGDIKAKIRAAAPDLLLVCLGAPKQELWMRDNEGKLPVGLMAGLGGSLDVFAGAVKRAPQFWQNMGLEWFYRLLREPKRIGRVMKLPQFIFAAQAEKRRRNVKG
ncbi:MAG: WecB/TagA/CpsF family glycosyltransferase [Oscillospiraceae bacterium]